MEKSCQSSADANNTTTSSSSTTTTNTANRDQYLKHLNKLSHKISKPIIKKTPFDPQTQTQTQNPNHNQNQNPTQSSQPQVQQQTQAQAQAQAQQQQQTQAQQQQQQHQPPVYNINKNDFRDVVQKLTGSPAHERFSTPPPIHAPKPPSSRLQRIRPPPLAHVSNRPPPLLNGVGPIPQQPHTNTILNPNNNNHHHNAGNFGRPLAPLSPLPPFPTVHGAAESPISAYMRFLQNPISAIDSNPKQFSGFSPLAPRFSPRWNASALPPPQQLQHHHQFPPPQQGMMPPPPPSQSQFSMPTSPLPFGCLNSPRSPYPLLSPSLLFSPSSGQLGFPQLPLSPTVPLPSPRWRALWLRVHFLQVFPTFRKRCRLRLKNVFFFMALYNVERGGIWWQVIQLLVFGWLEKKKKKKNYPPLVNFRVSLCKWIRKTCEKGKP